MDDHQACHSLAFAQSTDRFFAVRKTNGLPPEWIERIGDVIA
jgi:hypothetical protein